MENTHKHRSILLTPQFCDICDLLLEALNFARRYIVFSPQERCCNCEMRQKTVEKAGQAITDTELFGQEQNGLAEYFADPTIL